MVVFFWGYSGYSYSGLGITEYTRVLDLETESEVT